MGRETDVALKPEGNFAADVALNLWMSHRNWWTAAMKINAEKIAVRRGARERERQGKTGGPRSKGNGY